MQIEFIGAAKTVTGSKHLVHTNQANILLDCGLFQGRRQESIEINRKLGLDATTLSAVVLSHAHIDHSGGLPMLCAHAYDGPIYVTPATRDLCAAMLADAAMIQEQDARHINKSIAKDKVDMAPVEPLYKQEDVVRVLERMISVPYRRTVPIAKGVEVTFYDAGHVLGSAVTALDVEENGKKRRLVFTGDLGRKNIPILRDPEVVKGAHALIIESTYGDRLHEPITAMEGRLAEVLDRTYKRGGKVIIPSFALERAQEIIFYLKGLQKKGRMPKMPVYVDSPLTVKITDVFRLHPECYDAETRALIEGNASPFQFDALKYISDKEDSKAIDADDSPAVIISASGMCEAGRILHHLKASIENPKNTVAIVGFQAQHTLGRRIVEKRQRVKIFGVERDLRAEVVVMNGFSAHADQHDLIEYTEAIRDQGSLEHVALVHGEEKPQKVLIQKLTEKGFKSVRAPGPGDKLEM